MPDPTLRLKYYRETGQTELAKKYEQYLRETGQMGDDAVEVEAGYPERLATTVLAATQVVPGMKSFQAAMGSLGSQFTDHPVSYRDARAGLEEQTDRMGTGRQIAAKAAASPMLIPALAATGLGGASGAVQGAVIGGADQALDIDPDRSLGSHALRTAGGAAGGALLGAGIERAGNLIRANAGDRVVDAVKRYSPKARPAPAPTERLTWDGLLAKARAEQPHEVGSQFGDAEIAMGMDRPPLDLEALLKGSISHVQRGGTLQGAKANVPTYAGRPVGVPAPRADYSLTPAARSEMDAALSSDLGGLAQGSATARRSGLLNEIRSAPLPRPPVPSPDRVLKLLRGTPTAPDAVKVAGRVGPEIRRLDSELGTTWPGVARALGISIGTP